MQWCQNNNIPVSTFNGWIFPNNQKTKEKCQFVEINVPTDKTNTHKTELILIEYKDYNIVLACGATDMRKSINGLSEIVCSHFELDPRAKIIFAFCNSSRNRVKLLVWADNGFWINFKRIERGKVIWPSVDDTEETMSLSFEDLKNIIATPRVTQKIKRKEVWKKH